LAKLTPERILEIQEAYRKALSYKGASELLRKKGINVDERTVKRHAVSLEKTSEMSFKQKKGMGETGEVSQQFTKVEITTSKALKMFQNGKKPIEVAIELGLLPDRASKLYKGYLDLQGHGVLNALYARCGDKIFQFEKMANLQLEIETESQNLNNLRSTHKTENEDYVRVARELKNSQAALLETTQRNNESKKERGELETTIEGLRAQVEFYKSDTALQIAKNNIEQFATNLFWSKYNRGLELVASYFFEEMRSNSGFAVDLERYFKTPSESRDLASLKISQDAMVSRLVMNLTIRSTRESLNDNDLLVWRSRRQITPNKTTPIRPSPTSNLKEK